MGAHTFVTFVFSAWEAEAGGFQGQPGLQSDFQTARTTQKNLIPPKNKTKQTKIRKEIKRKSSSEKGVGGRDRGRD